MYLVIVSKTLEIFGTIITKKEYITISSATFDDDEAIKRALSWYIDNGWRCDAVFEARFSSMKNEDKVRNLFKRK